MPVSKKPKAFPRPPGSQAPVPAPVQSFDIRRPILTRLTRTFSGLTAGAILLLGCTSFVIARSQLSSRVLSQVASMASFREDVLEDAVRTERERTSLLAGRAEVRALPDADEPAATLASLLAEMRRQNIPVLGITLLDGQGRHVAHAGQESAPAVSDIAQSAVLPVIDRKHGWKANDVYVPLHDGSEQRGRKGYLVVRYDTAPVLATIFSAESLGSDASATLGVLQGGEVFMLHHSGPEPIHTLSLGSADEAYLRDVPLAWAVQGKEGVKQARNEHGTAVFAAYRSIPSLGWGMVVEIPVETGLSGVMLLGVSLSAAGLLLLVLAVYLAAVASRGITAPLRDLAKKTRALDPLHWAFDRTVHTGDEVEALDVSFTDLTGRLHAVYEHLEETVAQRTEELRKQSALDRAILETVVYGIIATDAKGIVTDANPASLELLQLEKSEIIGKRAVDVLTYTERHKGMPAAEHPLTRVLEKHVPYHSAAGTHPSLLRKNQTTLPVTFTVTPLLQGKKILGAIAMFQDMTEERQIDYLKSEFISLASHQLRTPLSSIRWYVELLDNEEKKSMSAIQKSYFAEIERASTRMANLLESLLHVAKLEGGGLMPELQTVDLSELASQIADEWTPIARERGVVLSVMLPHAGTTLRTDPVLLLIVLQNFLNNSLKYSSKGKEVHIRFRKEHERMIISVQDQGVGIPAAEQRRLFEKFFRAHNVRAMDTDGTGLGLYMSKAIAERLGGSIFFESEEGRGSTFTLVLPTHPRHA